MTMETPHMYHDWTIAIGVANFAHHLGHSEVHELKAQAKANHVPATVQHLQSETRRCKVV